MLSERGGVSTARTLLAKSTPSSGLAKLGVDFARPDDRRALRDPATVFRSVQYGGGGEGTALA